VADSDAAGYGVQRVRVDTVRELKAKAKNPTDPNPEEDEQWGRFIVELSRDEQAALDRATGVAAKIIGANTPRHHRMQALFQEYAAAHAVPEDAAAARLVPSAPGVDVPDAARVGL